MDLRKRWYTLFYPHFKTDRQLDPFLKIPANGPTLREARLAMFLSKAGVAERLDVSRQAYTDEIDSLARLRRTADAMGCEVVVAIRPKDGQLFSDLVWTDLLREIPAENLFQIVARQRSNLFRLRNGWSRNRIRC